ncbi:MAG: DNRLRE domain-containing protein [Anaerolineaceae bacterium]|nr:DNRLRE domain-containing protein [Anaerolineaceae bacterium]
MHPSFKLAKILGLFVSAGLVLSFMQVGMAQAASTSTTFHPTADAYVSAAAPSINYGASPTIQVDNSPVVRSYMRFTVSGISGTSNSATLKFYANTSQSTGFTVYKLSNNTWTESGIKYSNAPAVGAAINKTGAVTGGSWVSINVSSYITGNGTYNLVLETTSSTALSLASKENTTHAPQLVITSGTSVPPPAPSPTPAPGGGITGGKDPIIFFNGDLVSSTSVARAQLSANLIKHLMSLHPGVEMLVGDTGDNEQENNPTLANYQDYFGQTYETFVKMGIYRQVRGNHDIQSVGSYTDYNGTVHTSGAAYWDYFGANSYARDINGMKLTDYSYNLGAWHIVGLDQLSKTLNTTTLGFLNSDLAANTKYKCQLVYWHVPTFSSGVAHGDAPALRPLDQAEYNYGVDIQINGHDHDYQRFNPINASGQLDPAKGITTFIDGIGGQDGRSGEASSAAQAASAKYFSVFPGGLDVGAIQFTLHANSADYALYDAYNDQVIDSGTVNCH